jgi:hypothetical protein
MLGGYSGQKKKKPDIQLVHTFNLHYNKYTPPKFEFMYFSNDGGIKCLKGRV